MYILLKIFKKRTIRWLIISIVLLASIETEGSLNEVGLIKTIILGKEEANWRYA